MRALIGAILICIFAGYASAQNYVVTGTSPLGSNVSTALGMATETNGGFARINGSMTIGDCVKWSALGFQDAGVCGGGSGLPSGGTTSQVLVGGTTPAWGPVPQGALQVPINPQTTNYTIAASDQEKVVTNESGANTFSVTSAVTVGSNWATNILNKASPNLTVHSLGGTFNGSSADIILGTGDGLILISDGTNFSAFIMRGSGGSWSGYRVGNWTVPFVAGVTGTGGTATAGVAMCFAASPLETVTISSLGVGIAVGGTSNLQLAVYNDSPSGGPGTEIDATGNIADNLTGGKFGALSTTHQLMKGVTYWWCVNQNDSAIRYNAFTATSTIMGELIGSPNISSILTVNHLVGVQATVAYGTWGNFTSITFTDVTSNLIPPIAFLITSIP